MHGLSVRVILTRGRVINMLPIGSVIYLTEGNKKVMILSRGSFLEQKGEKVFFDYVGTMYPSGLASEQLYYFNEENIDKVVFEGFKDEEDGMATLI
jgi:hypothetical protein